jgi:hypothetical protein
MPPHELNGARAAARLAIEHCLAGKFPPLVVAELMQRIDQRLRAMEEAGEPPAAVTSYLVEMANKLLPLEMAEVRRNAPPRLRRKAIRAHFQMLARRRPTVARPRMPRSHGRRTRRSVRRSPRKARAPGSKEPSPEPDLTRPERRRA